MSPPVLVALDGPGPDGGDTVEVRAPAPGLWQPGVGQGQLVRAGDVLGTLHVLGAVHPVIAPPGARGQVVAIAAGAAARARVAVDHGARLLVVDPAHGLGLAGDAAGAAATAQADGGLVFRAPTSGRFYSRSAPGKPPFVVVGDLIRDGQTVCMLEVMKTFNRVVYQAVAGLPAEARVAEVAVLDEHDVDAGAVLLRLEPLP